MSNDPNVAPLDLARRRGWARHHRPTARPYDWADEHRHTFTFTVTRPGSRLVLAALKAIRTNAADELRADLHRQLAEQNPTTPAS
jgi:hypothetical protein